jgi:hypothetical protein
MTFIPDREELAWAAGFLDGEGCFSYTEKAGFACVSIAQTVVFPLARFRRAVGVGKIYGPYRHEHPRRVSKKPQWVFRAHRREHVQAIAALLWFKLGPTKRAQATVTLARLSSTCRRGHKKVPESDGCPRCVADAWAQKRLTKAAMKGQLTMP